jgi:sterol 3beta-glucosyltransferase
MKIGLQTWGSDGDIRPFLALAGGLRARSHEVSLIVTSVDNKDYSSYGRDMDFALSHVGTFSYDDDAIRSIRDKIVATEVPLTQIEIILRHFFNPVIPAMFDAAQQLCRDHDVIIGHTLHHPVQTAAELAGKPHVTVMYNHAGIYSKHARIFGVPDLGKWMNPLWWKLFHFLMDRAVGPDVNRLRQRVGLPPVKNIADTVWISKYLNLVAETSVIGRRQPDWPDHHHVCGVFSVPDKAEPWTPPDDLQQFLDAGPAPVYMTLGSMFSLDPSPEVVTETLLQSALLAGCRAIIQAPWDKIQNIVDDPRIYKIRKAPHQYLFPACSAVVHHGGAGTTHSATLHGCPSVVIEHFGDQTFFANELERLGVAPPVLHRRNLTAGKLASAIRAVLDSADMKRRAEGLGAMMQKENGVQKAVELIEKRFRS